MQERNISAATFRWVLEVYAIKQKAIELTETLNYIFGGTSLMGIAKTP